jgi:hypothetical protein
MASFTSLVKHLQVGLKLTQLKQPLKGRLMDLHIKIRQGWKSLPETNTLTYILN